MKNLFGKNLYFSFLVKNNKVLAYAIHYSQEKSIKHLKKIAKFHQIKGEIVIDDKLEKPFFEYIIKKIHNDYTSEIDTFYYKYSEIYEFLLNIKRGEVTRYSDIVKHTKYNIWTVIKALAYNPFLILIPCHRVIRKDGKISEYTPLGKEFKIRLLKEEGYLML